MRRFGSLKRIRAAGVDEIMEVPGIGRQTAEAIVAALASDEPAAAVDPATGEVLDDWGGRREVTRT
jgi:excinuclease ABC subunit C